MKFIFFMAFFVVGCSSLNESECRNANWFELGKKDAFDGKREYRNNTYRKDCEEFSVVVNDQKYINGFKQGLETLCTKSYGFQLGRWGIRRHLLCEEQNPRFAAEFLRGLEKYKQLQQEKAIEVTRKGIIRDFGGTCRSNRDCRRHHSACYSQKKCITSSKAKCRVKRNCKTHGVCEAVLRVTEFGTRVGVNVCKYGK